MISKMLDKGVHVDAANAADDGWTALHYASHEGLD